MSRSHLSFVHAAFGRLFPPALPPNNCKFSQAIGTKAIIILLYVHNFSNLDECVKIQSIQAIDVVRVMLLFLEILHVCRYYRRWHVLNSSVKIPRKLNTVYKLNLSVEKLPTHKFSSTIIRFMKVNNVIKLLKRM